MPAVTGRAKTHPQFSVLAVTGRKKAREDKCLSYPPWRHFGSPIVLLYFLSIFLEDFRGPRKTGFCLKITCSKSAGNHGALRAKSTNFQGLVFIPKTEKLERKNKNWCLGGLRMEDQGEWNPQTFLVNNFSFLQLRQNKTIGCIFKWVLNTDRRFKAAASTLENKNGNVQY